MESSWQKNKIIIYFTCIIAAWFVFESQSLSRDLCNDVKKGSPIIDLSSGKTLFCSLNALLASANWVTVLFLFKACKTTTKKQLCIQKSTSLLQQTTYHTAEVENALDPEKLVPRNVDLRCLQKVSKIICWIVHASMKF